MRNAVRAWLLVSGLALSLADCRLGYELLGGTGGESGVSANEGGGSNAVSLGGQALAMSDAGATQVPVGVDLSLGGESVGGQPSDAGSPGQSGGAQSSGGAGGSAANAGAAGMGATGGNGGVGGTTGGQAGSGGSAGAGGASCNDGGQPIANLVVRDTNQARAAFWGTSLSLQVGPSGSASHPWGDWPNTYLASADPAMGFLLGSTFVHVAAESKLYAGGPQATITLTCPHDLYLIVDDRWGNPAWLAGFTDTGLNVVVWESGARPSLNFSLWLKKGVSGVVDLPRINANTGYNYVPVVY